MPVSNACLLGSLTIAMQNTLGGRRAEISPFLVMNYFGFLSWELFNRNTTSYVANDIIMVQHTSTIIIVCYSFK